MTIVLKKTTLLQVVCVFLFTIDSISASVGSLQERIIKKYNDLVPFEAKICGDEAQEIVSILMGFVEIKEQEASAAKVLEFLNIFEERFHEIHSLVKNFPCLKNEMAISALLGFKPRSSISLPAKDLDFKALENAVCSIKGLDGYFHFEREMANKINWWDKLKFWLHTSVYMPSYKYDFTIENPEWVKSFVELFQSSGLPCPITLNGLLYGYDEKNTRLFLENCLTEGHSIDIIETKGGFWGEENKIFWRYFRDGKEAAKSKIRGYQVLLNLARMKLEQVE